MIKYVVFDWDGTLADTYPVISAAYDYTFDKLGLPRIAYDEVKRLTSTLQNKDTLGFVFGDRKEEAAKAYYEFITEHHAKKLRTMPGADELLNFCKQRKLPCFLITNKKRLYVLEEIEKLGFTDFFDKIVAAGECEQDKPHPIATHAVFDGKLPNADEILVIGDGVADYQTARTYDNNGKKAFCIIYDPKHKYNGDAPDYVVRDLLEVVNLIKEE